MRVYFRADASAEIGSGHVMRCLALAEALRCGGHDCEFVCREHVGHLVQLIEARGFVVCSLGALVDETVLDGGGSPVHRHWLGVDWEKDALDTLQALGGSRVDWLVVDHYALDARWERLVGERVERLMVIDDLADRSHYCHLLLDQNVLAGASGTLYKHWVRDECRTLLGPRYALLAPEYRRLAILLPERSGEVVRVLIFVGGSDVFHLTELFLQALMTSAFKHLYVDVVVGQNHPAPEKVHALAERRSRTHVYPMLPSLAGLMLRADLMLGGGGATNWERFCLGLPSLVASVALNQQSINEALGRAGLIHFLGKAERLTTEDVSAAMSNVIATPECLTAQSRAMQQVVDGQGAERVIECLSTMGT